MQLKIWQGFKLSFCFNNDLGKNSKTKPKHKDSIKDIIGYAITYSECVRGK